MDNNEKITEIKMYPSAFTKCRIGQDWYTNNFEVLFVPDQFYPDYMEVQRWIMDNIDGKEMNIEEAVESLYEMLSSYYPKHLKVTSHIVGCKTHFNVDVTKE